MKIKNLLFTPILMIVLVANLPSCDFQENDTNNQGKSNTQVIEEEEAIEEEPVVKEEPFDQEAKVQEYYSWPNRTDSFQAAFKEQFSDQEKEIIFAVNRVDQHNSWRPDTLLIPKNTEQEKMDFSPYPLQLEILKPVHKFVFFHYPLQVFAAYENGKLLKWGPTSMGTERNPTPTGLFFSNWKSKRAISTVNSNWILPYNFNIANFDGVGWHEYSMPGYPASHSCLRLWSEDAQWLYDFAEQWILRNNDSKIAEGTPVIVYGKFPFGERSPWLNGLENPESIIISVDEMNEIISEHLDKILEKQKEREDYLSTQ